MRTALTMHRAYMCFLLVFVSTRALPQTASFDYKRYLTGTPATLSLKIDVINSSAGFVTINGYDSRALASPFVWQWGDGTITSGYFPQTHTYADHSKNYVAKVLATYAGGGKDSLELAIMFTVPMITPVAIPASLTVTIPETKPNIVTRLYMPPSRLTAFNISMMPDALRPVMTYPLSLGAVVEHDLVNGDVYSPNGSYAQVVLRDSTVVSGGYALWCTTPMLICLEDGARKHNTFAASLECMGFNFALNSPAKYYYGGRVDGNANAIFTVTAGGILQVAAGYEIINNAAAYGLPPEMVVDMKANIGEAVIFFRSVYERYVATGKKFSSWNDAVSDTDETLGTFTTLKYKFIEKAENSGQGYRLPVRRMFKLLQGFNADWEQRYDRNHNTAAADTFRATLMTTAMSYAFQSDMRAEFRALNFPISDKVYNELYGSATAVGNEDESGTPDVCILGQNYPNPFNPSTTISFSLRKRTFVTLKIFDVMGREVSTLASEEMNAGSYQLKWNAAAASSGMYFYRLQAGAFTRSKKLLLVR